MILYFQNQHGKIRRIGNIDGRMSGENVVSEIYRQIKAFCDVRHYKIQYTRVWNEELNGKLMTKIDVGSHTEFFYIYPESYRLFQDNIQANTKEV